MTRMIFLRILQVWLIITSFSGMIYGQKMPDTSNDLYLRFCKSIESSSLNDLNAVMCTATMVKMKNEALSMGMEYPKDFFEGMKLAILDFENFKYINYTKQGPTLNAYYMYGENNEEANIVTLCLAEEDGKYKIDQFKVRDAKDFILNLHNKDYSFLDLAEFKPSGVVPEVPKEVEKVDYVANVDIVAYGYKVMVTINGFFQDEVINKSRGGVVIGGIKKGENTVELQVEKVNPAEKDNPALSIRALINGEEKEVFVIYEEMSGRIARKFTIE